MSTWSQQEVSKLKQIADSSKYFEDVYIHFPNRSKASIRYKIAQIGIETLISCKEAMESIKSKKSKATLSQRYSSLISAAKKRNLTCTISKEEYSVLLSLGRCAYCDYPIDPTGSALDRKDNLKGYLLENIVLCCKNCNSIKGSILTYEEMLIMMKAILHYRDMQK